MADEMERVLNVVRPAVRRMWVYRVGGAQNVSVKLDQNESPFDLPDDVRRELARAYASTAFNRYPEIQPRRLERALGKRLDWPADGILAGHGSNELTAALGVALVERGTPVVLPRPMFAYFDAVMRLMGGCVREVGPRADLSFDAEALLAAVADVGPAVTVLTTPNNPTGLSMPLEEIEAVVAQSPGIVVVDEAYLEFTEEKSARAILGDRPNLVLLRTFSKAFGLAGLRIGYMVGHPALMAEISKARPPFMTDRMSELAALKLLERPGLVQRRVAYIKRETKKLYCSLSAIDSVHPLPSQANFVTFRTPMDAAALTDRLSSRGVMVRNMSGYRELGGYLRVSAGLETENKAFLAELKAALGESGKTPRRMQRTPA